jgi:hypothetical protein
MHPAKRFPDNEWLKWIPMLAGSTVSFDVPPLLISMSFIPQTNDSLSSRNPIISSTEYKYQVIFQFDFRIALHISLPHLIQPSNPILTMPSAAQGPSLQRIHRSEVDRIIQAIIDDGGAIIKNFATTEAVERVNADTRPYLDADKPWKVRLSKFDSTVQY